MALFMTIRERTENFELNILSQYACASTNSKGRQNYETPCNIRTCFQRDRDRIIHSKAFRRLKYKTQVFNSSKGDHYRTRLTHTLEVSQIARTISRALLLNEDLTESIALSHDLGHTPFGHAGESALDQISENGFKHFEQSLRVVDKLENSPYGLNLTIEVRDGILNHTKGQQPFTLEGRVVRLSDRIAYVNHDIDDAIRACVLKASDLPSESVNVLGQTSSMRINTLVESIIENTDGDNLKMSDKVLSAFDILHEFMYDQVYLNEKAKTEEDKVPHIINELYKYFKSNYRLLPTDMQMIANAEGIDRAVCDYIAGMTDKFAIQTYKDIFIPKSFEF